MPDQTEALNTARDAYRRQLMLAIMEQLTEQGGEVVLRKKVPLREGSSFYIERVYMHRLNTPLYTGQWLSARGTSFLDTDTLGLVYAAMLPAPEPLPEPVEKARKRPVRA